MRLRTLDELEAFGHYARRLPSFVRETLTPELGRERVERQLANREQTFLTILEGGVYGNPRSPYRALLQAAGIELGDVRRLIDERGLEGALERLHDAGVYATLDEFKGRRPIERGEVSLDAGHGEFDNPLIVRQLWTKTSGSRSAPRSVPLDLDSLEHDAAHDALFRTAFGLWGREVGLWRVRPPSTAGITNVLRQAKLGEPLARWFDPYRGPRDLEALKYWLFTAYTAWAGRLHGVGLARPRHCPCDQAHRVARWLEARRLEGRPVHFDAQAGLAVRVCRSALSDGIDISGTFFRVGGEPLTRAKADVIAASGCRVVTFYSMTETGRIAVACPSPEARDDMHFLSEKLAVLQRQTLVGSSGTKVGALFFTTLLPSTPKIMINVESGDSAVLEERSCGCPWDEMGLSLHLREVSSYEKLTSEGNNFLGSDVFALVDDVLPQRFGGGPTDYQIIEEEVEGLTRVTVVVRPAIGALTEEDVFSVVMDFLRSKRDNQPMADFWQQSDTVRVMRREPHVTASGKTPPLYVEHSG